MNNFLIVQDGKPFYQKKIYKFKSFEKAHAKGLYYKIIKGCKSFTIVDKLSTDEKKILEKPLKATGTKYGIDL